MSADWGKTAGALALLGVLLLAGASAVSSQAVTATIRIAFLSQWVVSQHRASGKFVPAFRSALDRGVVDRTVFAWQRGAIQRQALVTKPVRVLAGPEATELGGRGEFRLVAVRPPRGPAAWSEVDVEARSGQPDEALVLELGGELNTVAQVLETLLIARPDALEEAGLARVALLPGHGVPVIRAPFGRPLEGAAARLRDVAGMGFLVARSPVETVVNGAVDASGVADASLHPGNSSGDWREGDRLFIRVPLAALRDGVPPIVLGWKDRTLKPDPEGLCMRAGC